MITFTSRFISLFIHSVLWLTCVASLRADHAWQPVNDDVFLQEVVQQIPTDSPLLSTACLDKTAYVCDATQVYRVIEGELHPLPNSPAAVRRLRVLQDTLWAITDQAVWQLNEDSWVRVVSGEYVDICEHVGGIILASAERLYQLDGSRLQSLNPDPAASTILGVQSYSETIYVRHADFISFLKSGRFEVHEVEDWGEFPVGAVSRDMTSLGNRLVLATSRGLAVLRGASWHHVAGPEGLPYEDTNCVTAGFAHDCWIGTKRGLIRSVDGEFHYFGHKRWLPHDQVNSVAAAAGVVYAATEGGLAILSFEPYTLLKKAAWYKRHLKDWGMLRLGMVTLLNQNADGTYTRAFGDNDIGYTCHYLNALCFEYAVTRDDQVRAEAVDVFKTIKWSEEITPLRGYPARSIHAVGEEGRKATLGSAGRPAEWNPSEDGQWVWKGDTSSDEIVAHIYTVSLFHDLVAQGEEKKKAVEHLERIIGHIVDNGWKLMDLDGRPTVWGQWNPDFVYSPDHTDERGLNSLQALSFAAVANRLFPDSKFAKAREDLIQWGYLENVLRQKRTFPHYTRFDDRLAFLAYFPLLRYETDPEVRAPLMRSLQRSWEIKRIEKQTWFNFIYGALSGNECETAEAVEHLRLYPLDALAITYTNSHRSDLQNPSGYINYLEQRKPLTPRDVGFQRWNRSFQQLDKKGARAVIDPSGWLDAYWMGRYYGMILSPVEVDPALTTVPARVIPQAPPAYQGPPRPHVF